MDPEQTRPSPPSGVCLVDPRTGLVIAADEALGAWLGNPFPPAEATCLGEVLFGDGQLPAETPTETHVEWGTGDQTQTVRVRCIPLRSVGAELILIDIGPAQPGTSHGPLDAVTGLPDRRALEPHRATWIRAGTPHAVLFLDLDGFKQVNDRCGHDVGDQVLAELAHRWQDCLREGDLVTRYGGDEFVVLLGHVAGPREIEPIIHRLEAATARPFTIDGRQVVVSVTIGVALSDGTSELKDLIASADQAMYRAKQTRLT